MSEINIEEYSIVKCKECGETKKRYNAGKYPNNKDTRFVDELGKEWSGKRCPECQRARSKSNKRKKSLSKVLGTS